MHYVYIIKSATTHRIYIGSTEELVQRIQHHNYGANNSTKKDRPWIIVWYAAFLNKLMAGEFEQYLKTGSGREFVRKWLI